MQFLGLAEPDVRTRGQKIGGGGSGRAPLLGLQKLQLYEYKGVCVCACLCVYMCVRACVCKCMCV